MPAAVRNPMRNGSTFLASKMRQRKAPRTSNDRRPSHCRPSAAPASAAVSPPATDVSPGDGSEWIYGRHAALAAIANPRRRLRRIVAAADLAPRIAAAAAGRGAAIPSPMFAEPRALAALLPDGAVHQGLAVLAASLPPIHLEDLIASAAAGPATVVVLDQATDPRNVGAVLRAAAAFAALGVVVQDRHAPAATGALAKAASGALERVPLVRVVNIARALRLLQAAEFWCAGFAGDGGMPIDAAPFDRRVALVLGAEDSGLRRLVRDSCDEIVRIPIAAAMESLNVATAAAIALYEVGRRVGWPGGEAARLTPGESAPLP